MENEENGEVLDTENEENEQGSDEETQEENQEATEDVDEESRAEVEKYKKIAEDQKVRAEKAESKLKKSKSSVETETPKKETSTQTEGDSLSRDEAKLYARGLTDEQVDKVAQIAKMEDITLDEASKSDYYTIWNDKQEKEQKQEKAQMRASRGGKAEVKKTFDTPGLSQEEHKALWKEANQ